MPMMFRAVILGSVLILLEACSSIRFSSETAISAASFRKTPEPPAVAVRLLVEPLIPLKLTPLAMNAEPIKITKPMIENILFDPDSTMLTPLAIMQLDEFVSKMTKTDYQIFIEGHTDNTHNAIYNQALSEKRAKTVKSALIARGIPKTLLMMDAYGETQSIAPNLNEYGKQQNRRVELKAVPLPSHPATPSLSPTQQPTIERFKLNKMLNRQSSDISKNIRNIKQVDTTIDSL